ncbi:hypothetical protein [Niallia endozanthoxylica]|uniref:Uncharacterized protein n=1 Tax=Niallia endozanthoxylica TaxID=2036016 RepID=A0A5J5H7Q7_9BACI|nr:hypothetical protein [Niallia endozanthoxylica]KAA9015978.1 hypothetical protein F4V44_22235 [Niallia endozanthoxylica]
MFQFMGLLKTMGVVIFTFIATSFLLGFFNINNVAFTVTVLYVVCYILTGVLSPIWNPETPYIASYLASLTLTVLNLLFAVTVLDIMVFADPMDINRGLARNTLVSLFVTFVWVKIVKWKQEKEHG